MLSASKASALASTQASRLSKERDDALMYYMGDMSGDMPAQEGRSQAVSTDVADTIEGLMPALMDIFAGADETVTFNPVSGEDVAAAQQETDYINHVFMQQNPGFLVLYSFIKDALLSKVGVVKVWWEEREEEQRETYYGLTPDAFALVVQSPDIEVIEHTANPDGTHDVVVTQSKKFAEAKCLGVPPEEFGIEKGARSIRTCNYCFHKVFRTQTQLIEQGYDEKQVKTLPTYMATTNPEELHRDTAAEHQMIGEETNSAARQIEVIEHYIRMDYDGKGKACLYRVTTGGDQGDILQKDGKDDIEPFDQIPFAAMTPVIMTHRFFGRSIADLVMDIQRIKTALLRAYLDNRYLANNQRVEVSETHASENTLDDLLISRPGGIVRTKMPGGLNWQVVPDIGADIFPALEYMDSTREMRTGVSRAGQGLDADALQNQSATAVNQMFTMAQARMKLIARIFAETGIKDLFTLLHATVRKHGQEAQTVRLRNQWVQVDPRNWKTRNDMTVHVGLGTGGKAEQLQMATLIIGLQEKALAAGKTNLVSDANLYNSAKMVTRITGHKDIDAFFTDPQTQPPPQTPPDPKLMELQMKAQIDQQKVQADIQHQAAKLQADASLEQMKFEHEKQLALIQAELDARDKTHQMALNERKAQVDERVAMTKLQIHGEQVKQKTEAAKAPKASIEVKHGADEITGPIGHIIKGLGEHLATHQAKHTETIIAALSKPKRIVRDPKSGKALGVETVG